jgi:uncharacterized protein (DUF58 family)
MARSGSSLAAAPERRWTVGLLRWLLPWRADRGPHPGERQLGRRSVYILPTRAGLLMAAVLVTMLVTSINYALALGYALTFLLASVWLVGMVHTWRNLAGLVLRAGRADPVHAGDFAEHGIVLRNPAGPERFALDLVVAGTLNPVHLDVPVGPEHLAMVALPTKTRGWHDMPRMRLQTRWPLGLWRAWAYWHPQARLLVLPQPEPAGTPLPIALSAGEESQGRNLGDDDPAAIRPWRSGDSPRRLAWKAIARLGSEGLLVTEFEGGQGGLLWLDWKLMPAHLDPEARISRLTRWVIDAEAAGLHYGLRLPQTEITPDRGPAHRAQCLRELALAPV